MKIFRSVRTAQILFGLNTLIWIIFGVVSLLKIGDDLTTPRYSLWIIAILMFGNAVAMALSGYGLSNKGKLPYSLAMIVLGINIILTVTDQVGIFDWVTLIIDFILLTILIAVRKEYL